MGVGTVITGHACPDIHGVQINSLPPCLGRLADGWNADAGEDLDRSSHLTVDSMLQRRRDADEIVITKKVALCRFLPLTTPGHHLRGIRVYYVLYVPTLLGATEYALAVLMPCRPAGQRGEYAKCTV